MSLAPTRVGVGSGAAAGTPGGAGAGGAARGGAGEPEGSLSTVPVRSGAEGSSPLAAAICDRLTPALAARPDSVSPVRTAYRPAAGGAPPVAAEVAGAGVAGAEPVPADEVGACGATPWS